MKKIEELKKKAPQGGFTLIEILIVIGIIAILAAIVLVAVNPAEQFKKAGDAQRSSNVNAVLNAVGQYMVDNQGNLPAGIPTDNDGPEVGTDDSDVIGNNTGEMDLCVLVPEYIAGLPGDPDADDQTTTDAECDDSGYNYSTEYRIYKSDGGRVTIFAPNTDIGEDISVTR